MRLGGKLRSLCDELYEVGPALRALRVRVGEVVADWADNERELYRRRRQGAAHDGDETLDERRDRELTDRLYVLANMLHDEREQQDREHDTSDDAVLRIEATVAAILAPLIWRYEDTDVGMALHAVSTAHEMAKAQYVRRFVEAIRGKEADETDEEADEEGDYCEHCAYRDACADSQ